MRLAITLIILLAGTSATLADCHRAYVQPSYQTYEQSYVATVAVPVFVPTFSFTFLSTQAVPAATSEPVYGGATARATTPAPSTPSTAPNLQEQVASILKARCASCHSGAGKKGVSFFDAQGAFKPTVDPFVIYGAASASTEEITPMPPGVESDAAKAMPDNELKVLLAYALKKRKASQSK